MVANLAMPSIKTLSVYADDITISNMENVSNGANFTENLSENTSDENNISPSDSSIVINGVTYHNEKELEDLLVKGYSIDGNTKETSNSSMQPRAFAAPAIPAAAYFIPGVGKVLVLATGVIIIGGVTIKAGHWAYNKIKSWLSNPRRNTARYYNIPERLLDSRGNVRLGDFKVKVRGKNAWKDPKTGYTKEKDTAGHGGKKWKIKDKSGKRKASTDGNGKILSK